MARPERNTIDYFPHLLGEGKKMFFIENKYGNNGYATWYKILEKLGSTEYHYLNLNREDEVMFLASKCKVSEEMLILIINDLSKMDVFSKELWVNKIVWCPQFIESIEDAYKKRNNKCITLEGLRILLTSLGILKPVKCILKGSDNTQSKVEYNKVKDIKEDNIDLRKLKFSETLKPFLTIYGKDMLNDFYGYWTESNKTNTKFKQELQKTWDVKRRLETWSKNNFGNKQFGNTEPVKQLKPTRTFEK